jgi:thiol:disulfide interchange protein DsbD
MKKILSLTYSLLFFSALFAQNNPVKWSYEAVKTGAGEYDLVFTAHAQTGWYVYSQYLESDEGPIATSFSFEKNGAVEFVGKTKEEGHKHEGFDDLFGMNIVKFSGVTKFTQRIKAKTGTTVAGFLTFMTCDNERCLPPVDVDFKFLLP